MAHLISRLTPFAAAMLVLLLRPAPAAAHCDGLDGPVVTAAVRALERGDVALVLPWVREEDEPEIAAAFRNTLAVRRLGPDARALADRYFYETLVRVHRAGEGQPYTGLKEPGRDLGPAIPAADRALDTGSPDALVDLLTQAARTGVRKQYEKVLHARQAASPGDVAAGRQFVAVYVSFIHYVERLFEAADTAASGHFPEPAHVDPAAPPQRSNTPWPLQH